MKLKMKYLTSILILAIFLLSTPQRVEATFANIGSAEGEFSSVTSASDSITPTIPTLAAESIGVVYCGIGAGALDVSSATWGGEAMTAVAGATITDGTVEVNMFYLANPPDAGVQTITCTYSTSAIHEAHVVAVYADADGAVTLDDSSETSGTSQNPTITMTQAGTNELVVTASYSNANAVGSPSTTACTELQNSSPVGNSSIICYEVPAGSGDTTHTHNYSQSGSYAIAGVSFQEAGAPPPSGDATTYQTTTWFD